MQANGDGSLPRGLLPRGWVLIAATAMVMSMALTGCQGASEGVVQPTTSERLLPGSDAASEHLARLRTSDYFDEFAEHKWAAKADGARLAWENFAPIVDGKRVEWSNKAELWDSIAPKIRDEALLLGPEYRKPMWNATRAVPNAVAMAWSDARTNGRGQYVEFSATYSGMVGPAERFWGFLIETREGQLGAVVSTLPPFDLAEADFPDLISQTDELQARTWAWIEKQPVRP